MQAPLEPTDWSAPSLESVWPATVSMAMPERTEPVSAHPKLTTTFSLFQPSLLAAGEREPLITGVVLSIETTVTLSEDSVPAPSAQVPSAFWSAPSFVKVCETCAEAAPERPSAQSQ